MTFCLPTKCRYIQTTLFGTVLQEKVGTIYDHPTTQYEQFIERYYGRPKGSGKSKAMVISDGQVILLDIRGVTLWGEGGGGSNFRVANEKSTTKFQTTYTMRIKSSLMLKQSHTKTSFPSIYCK